MSHNLGMFVVAEGIETSEQLSFLRGIGCEMGQGFYFSRALPKNKFDEYMRNHMLDKKIVSELDFRLLLDVDDIWFPNSKFNFIFNHFVGALALYEFKDTGGTLIRTNDEYFKVLKYTPEDVALFRDDITTAVHPDDLPGVTREMSKLRSIGKTATIELRTGILTKRTRFTWVKMHAKVVAAEKNSSLVLISIENIDKERKALEKLHKAAERRKELENQLSIYKNVGGDGIFSARIQDGIKLEYANEQFCKIHGITKSYAMKKRNTILEELIVPEERESVLQHLENCIANKETKLKVTLSTNTKTNVAITLYLRATITYGMEYPILDAVIQDMSVNS